MNLHIPIKLWQRMHYYANICAPNEVTGIGTIRASPNLTELQVTEIFLPQQHANNSFCQFDEGALNAVIYDLICQDPERSQELRFRWHSHGESPTFYSATDLRDIETWESDWVVNMIINVHQDYVARLDLFAPLRVRDIPLDLIIDYPDDPVLYSQCVAETQKMVQFYPFAKEGKTQ